MCDFPGIRKHKYPSFLKLYYRICTGRHIGIEIIDKSHNVLFVLPWVGRISVNILFHPLGITFTNILPTHVKKNVDIYFSVQQHYGFIEWLLNHM